MHGEAPSQQWWGHRWEEIWVINFRTRADGKAGGFTVQNLPPVLLASEQAARPGARAEHSHQGWVLLTLVNWKRIHLAVPTGTPTCLHLYLQRSGVGSADPDVQIHIHTAEGLPEQLPWVPSEHSAAQCSLGTGYLFVRDPRWLGWGGGVIAGALPGLAGLLPDCKGL